MLMEISVGLIIGTLFCIVLEIIGQKTPYFKKKFYSGSENIPLVFGYHFHHSLLGAVSIIFGFLSIFWIGFGIGIIIVHTIVDGRFVFIEKGRKKISD